MQQPAPRQPEPGSAAPSTRQLLQALTAGERQAEGQLFERHRPQLLAHARRHRMMRGLHRHTTPEDIVDEALLRALSSRVLSDFEDRGPGSLRNMLLTIVDRVLVDMKRRFDAAKRGGGELPLSVDASPDGETPIRERLLSPATTPTQAAAGADFLTACRDLLTERELEVWQLTVERGWNAREAAERLGVSEAVVRSLLFRAREKIRAGLGE